MKPSTKSYRFFGVEEVPRAPGRKTAQYRILNNSSGDEIGRIAWYPSWRQFCFFPAEDTVWSASCFRDVLDAIAWAVRQRA